MGTYTMYDRENAQESALSQVDYSAVICNLVFSTPPPLIDRHLRHETLSRFVNDAGFGYHS